MTTAPAAAVAAAGCDTGAPAAVEILVEGRPTDVEEVSGNDDEAAPMLTAAAADAASASASAAPFNKDYRLDFTDVEGNLEEIPEEGTARMAAAAGSGRKLEPAEIADLDGGNKDGGGGAVVESAEAASAPALVAAPTAHFHIPESNASDYAYSECSFQVRYSFVQLIQSICGCGKINCRLHTYYSLQGGRLRKRFCNMFSESSTGS